MLEALDASLTTQRQLVADASHELRTPLTSIKTNIEVLQRGRDLPHHVRERLMADVAAQIEELTHLVADVVDLGRGQELPREVEDIRLDLLVNSAVERTQRRAPHASFVVEAEPSLIRGVPARLDRAIANLLDNAAKWNQDGAPIEVRVRAGEVVIRDHGPGVAPADIPHIFDRFYRAPTARSLPGSGLGLAIVRQVAEMHGGSVSVGVADGGGAVFRLKLPPDAASPAGSEDTST